MDASLPQLRAIFAYVSLVPMLLDCAEQSRVSVPMLQHTCKHLMISIF